MSQKLEEEYKSRGCRTALLWCKEKEAKRVAEGKKDYEAFNCPEEINPVICPHPNSSISSDLDITRMPIPLDPWRFVGESNSNSGTSNVGLQTS